MVYYFAQNCTIAAKAPNSNTYEVIGAAQEVSFEMNFEDVKLYQFGSVKRADAARHSLSIPVTVKLAKFSNVNSKNDWFWAILNGNGWLTQTSGNKEITISDSSSFPMFMISGEFRPTDGSDAKIYVEASDVYFKTFQWGGSIGEYIMENLEGEGADIKFLNHTPSGFDPEDVLKVVQSTPVTINGVGTTASVTLNKTGEPFLGTSDATVATVEWDTITTPSTPCIKITGVSGSTTGKTAYIFAGLQWTDSNNDVHNDTISFEVIVKTTTSNEDSD